MSFFWSPQTANLFFQNEKAGKKELPNATLIKCGLIDTKFRGEEE